MFRRLAPLFVIALLLTAVLAACGDETASVPSYAGATSVTVPDSVKTQFASAAKDLKNTKYEAFSSDEDTGKVKTFFQDSFKKDSWDDKVSTLIKDSDAKTFEQLGMFVLGYQKGNKGAIVMGFPGSLSSAMGFTGAEAKKTVYMVISGNE